jgi:hypothetical protein
MWNYLSQETCEVEEEDADEDDHFNTTTTEIVSSCWGTMKCNNRTLIQNEKYRVYEFRT